MASSSHVSGRAPTSTSAESSAALEASLAYERRLQQDPADAEPVERDGVKFIGLARLVELKLASGMSGGPDRAKDLIDVQQLVKTASLPRDFSERLHPDVRAKYHELWDALHAVRKKYVRVWNGTQEQLSQMQADGVTLDSKGRLVTTDRAIAEKYEMHDESEFFDFEDESG